MSPWQTFLNSSHTLGPSPGVREQWRSGRSHYAVWALPVSDPRVLQRAAQVQRALAAHIQAQPLAQAHITLWVGGFVDGDGTAEDDLDGEARAAIQERIRAWDRPINVQITGASSFLSCPFLEVQQPGSGLNLLREEIGSIHPKEIRFSNFIPHLTLGTYAATEATEALVKRLRPFRDLPPIELTLRPCEAQVDAGTGALSWL